MQRRPDGRLFIPLRDAPTSEYRSRLVHEMDAHDQPIHVHVDLANAELAAVCEQLGFTSEIISQAYSVSFDAALERLRPRNGSKHQLVPADEVDVDALLALDQELRQDVPGTAGWVGDREGFAAELASPEFDATGYLVARNPADGSLTGLIRFWRNADGPRLGLIAVVRSQRGGFLAHELLREGLEGASAWGFDAFTTETARPALQRRLERIGGTLTRTFAQMVSPHAGR